MLVTVVIPLFQHVRSFLLRNRNYPVQGQAVLVEGLRCCEHRTSTCQLRFRFNAARVGGGEKGVFNNP